VVLTDTAGVVIGVNPAAERRIGVIEAHAIGRNLESVVADSGPEVRLEISPILSAGREAGQLVLIDPPRKNSRS
jgi:PAS domain-containing protein